MFRWTEKANRAAIALADGKTILEASELAGVTDRTIYNWKNEPEFSAEVDRLTLMTGISARAERLRIAKRVVAQRIKESTVETEKDILDWLKFAQGETDGIKLDLAAVHEAFTSVADSGQTRPDRTEAAKAEDSAS